MALLTLAKFGFMVKPAGHAPFSHAVRANRRKRELSEVTVRGGDVS